MLNIRYQFQVGADKPYFMKLGIMGVENGHVEHEFKSGAQVISRDYSLEIFDKNNNELFVNDIIKESNNRETKFHLITYNGGKFSLEEITGINFDGQMNFGTTRMMSKLVKNNNNKTLKDVTVIGNIYDLYNNTLTLK